MKLTTKGRFAVTAMLDLSIHSADKKQPVTLASISARQGISLSYLEQLFTKLRRKGLVSSVRGPGGGYVLAQQHHQINISSIINAVEDTLDATQCGGQANCQEGEPCLTHDLWHNLNRTIDNYLSAISLADVVRENRQKQSNTPYSSHTITITTQHNKGTQA